MANPGFRAGRCAAGFKVNVVHARGLRGDRTGLLALEGVKAPAISVLQPLDGLQGADLHHRV